MALNVKVAMVTCLFFIGGMSWMVHQVATPVIAAPAPTVVLRAPAEVRSLLTTAPQADDRQGPAGQFAHASATAPSELGAMLQSIAFPAMARADQVGADLPPIAQRRTYATALSDATTFLTADDFEPTSAGDEIAAPAALLNRSSMNVPMAVLASNARIVEEFEFEESPVEALLTETPERVDIAANLVAYPEDSGVAEVTQPIGPPSGKQYVVRRGDSIVKVLKKEWSQRGMSSINAFLAVNPKVRDRKNQVIRIGETVVIPSRKAAMAYMALTLSDAAHQEAARKNPRRRIANHREYKVKRHDTLVKIAREKLRDSDRWTEIVKLNGMKNADVIIPGTVILLPEQNGLKARVGA